MRLLHGLVFTLVLITSCGWMACGCVPPAGLNFNVFQQSTPAPLTGTVDASGKATFDWTITANNVAVQTSGVPDFADVMPHLTGRFELDPAPTSDTVIFQTPQGILSLQEGEMVLTVLLEDQNWTLKRQEGKYVVPSFLALKGRTTEQTDTTQLLQMLQAGPAHQVHLNFSVQTPLPAGTHITLWLQETRVHFR